MNNRSLLYTILAVAVGYLIVSSVPGQLSEIMQPKMKMAGVEDSQLEEEPESALGGEEVFSVEENARVSTDSVEDKISEIGTTWFQPSIFIYFLIDLFIALGVYIVFKRRFF